MKNKDLVALAALAAGAYGLKQARDVDAALGRMKYDKKAEELGYPVSKNEMSARRGGPDPLAEDKALSSEAKAAARRNAAREELNPEGRIGGHRIPLRSGSGEPVTTRYGSYAHTEEIPDSSISGANFRRGMKKGGAVKTKSASSRADGIAQRGKTKGRIV